MSILHGLRLTLAVLAVTASLAACSRSAESHFDAGSAYLDDENVQAAALEFRLAVQKDPLLAPAHVALAELYLQQGNGSGALGAYVRAADLLPDDITVQLLAGTLLLLAGQSQDAVVRADKAIALDADNVEALMLRGNALAGLRDLDGAVKQILEAIALDPSAARQVNLGVLQVAHGRQAEAEATFRQAMTTSPESMDARLALANFLLSTGRGEESEEAFKAALSLDSRSVEANRALATFYLASNRDAEAEQYLRTTVEAGDDPADSLALADHYVRAERNAEALAVLEQLGAAPQTRALARSRIATLSYAEGKLAEAHRTIDDVLAEQPGYFGARVVRGRFLLAEERLLICTEN